MGGAIAFLRTDLDFGRSFVALDHIALDQLPSARLDTGRASTQSPKER